MIKEMRSLRCWKEILEWRRSSEAKIVGSFVQNDKLIRWQCIGLVLTFHPWYVKKNIAERNITGFSIFILKIHHWRHQVMKLINHRFSYPMLFSRFPSIGRVILGACQNIPPIVVGYLACSMPLEMFKQESESVLGLVWLIAPFNYSQHLLLKTWSNEASVAWCKGSFQSCFRCGKGFLSQLLI